MNRHAPSFECLVRCDCAQKVPNVRRCNVTLQLDSAGLVSPGALPHSPCAKRRYA